MHILLTDQLTCPRCGPAFSLILLADRLEERRVLEGELGCSNCRQSYRIERGIADLRFRGGGTLRADAAPSADPERPFRTAALLGVTTTNSTLLVVQPGGGVAAAMAGFLPNIHLIQISGEAPVDGEASAAGGETAVLSSIRSGSRLPLRGGSMAGVALLDIASPEIVLEAVRLLAPGARLLVDPAPPEIGGQLHELGLTVHLEQDGVAVAAAPGLG